MKIQKKLEILADAAKYDASCASSAAQKRTSSAKKGELGSSGGTGICHSYTPDGRCVSLLKILFTNHCIYDCSYCINRSSSPTRRASFTVSEVVWLTIEFYKRNYIEGLFLSSGVVGSADGTMEKLVDVARKLRVEERFRGYIHLKAVAGCSQELVRKAALYADRISSNIELPLQKDLDLLAPGKSHETIENAMRVGKEAVDEGLESRKKKQKSPILATGQSTQLIVGATTGSDAELLTKANRLYDGYSLKRVYYSAFSPIPHSDSRLPGKSPPLVREHRLYQADWLMRFYGFDVAEITPIEEPNLSLDIDPKHSWALRNRHLFPVDINRAEREMLLRVPGLGVRSVDKIIKGRRFRKLKLSDLKAMRVRLKLAQYFIVCAEANPEVRHLDKDNFGKDLNYFQPTLFEDAVSAKSGEV